MRPAFLCPMNLQEIAERLFGGLTLKNHGHRGTPKTPTENPAQPPLPKGRGVCWGARCFFGVRFRCPPHGMPGAGGSESARNCREAFRCGWWDFGSYTLFKDPEFQLLPITALTCSRTCGFRARVPGALRVVLPLVLVLWCLRCGACAVVPALWCWCWCWCCGAGAGACAVVLVPALWCWCCGAGAGAVVLVPALWCCLPRGVHSFRVPGLVVSRMRCKGIGAPALPMSPAPTHKPRVV